MSVINWQSLLCLSSGSQQQRSVTDSILEKVQSLGLPGLQQPGPFSTRVLPLLEADWLCLNFVTASEHLEIGSGREEVELITAS